MTQQGYSPSRAGSGTSSVPQAAKHETAEVGRSAAERVGDVTGVVGEQAKQVVSETGTQARQLFEEGVDQLRGQARDGQRKLAASVREVAGQLRQMSDRSEDSGMASTLVRQATDRADQVASWLDEREPGDLIAEVRRFARRRPGWFLAGATAAGLLAGRLTRNIVSSGEDGSERGDGQFARGGQPFERVRPGMAAPDPMPPMPPSAVPPPPPGPLPGSGPGSVPPGPGPVPAPPYPQQGPPGTVAPPSGLPGPGPVRP